MPSGSPTPAPRSAPPAVRRALALASAALALAAFAAPAAQAAPASFAGASADGSRVFFTTTDKLVPGDTDRGFKDVYERSYDGEDGIETYVTRELSTGPTGGNDAYPAEYRGASRDGSEVFFATQEPLVVADRDRAEDLYVRDTATGATTLVSRAAPSCETGGCGEGPADVNFKGATPGGGTVFFQTTESLTPEDTDEAADVYARDLGAGTTTLVSRASASCSSGGCGNGPEAATFVGASENGQRVFFETAESLVPADTDSNNDVYMRDLEAVSATTTLVTPEGTCTLVASECKPKFRGVDASGARVFFTTSEKLSAEDTDGTASDVYAWEEGAVPPISLVSTGPTATNEAGKPASLAGSRADGAMVFFETGESLTGGDADGGASDVYARDLEAEPPTTTLVSEGDPSCVEAGSCGAGGESEVFAGTSASGDVVFVQTKEKLSPEDTDSGLSDVYARSLDGGTTTLVSAADPACAAEACGAPKAAVFAGASASGTLAFFTTEESLVPGDAESKDVYGRDLGGSAPALESPAGVCPLPGEAGCNASFSGASEEGTRVFFSTARRLTAEDVDSDEDVYERDETEGVRTRLVSASNSVELGPGTPVLSSISPGARGETLSPAVHGHAAAGTSIKVYRTSDCSGGAVAGTVEELEGPGIEVTVQAGRTTALAATATDAGGITSECSNVLDYTQEAAPPPGGGGGGGGGGGEGGGSTGDSESSTGSSTGGGSAGGSGGGGGIEIGGIVYVAPQTRITFGPAFKTRARRAVFRFFDATEQPGSRFVCRLDRQRWRGCGSPFRTRLLKPGRHVFRVKGESAAGQWQAQPVKRRFKVVRR